jgi:hypothetical protein
MMAQSNTDLPVFGDEPGALGGEIEVGVMAQHMGRGARWGFVNRSWQVIEVVPDRIQIGSRSHFLVAGAS